MTRAATVPVIAATLASAPALAQSGAMVASSQDAIGKVGVVEREVRQSDAAVRSMVRCISDRLPTKVSYALSTVPGSAEEDRALSSFQSRYEWCMPRNGHNGLRFNWTLVRGAFAEEMLHRQFASGVAAHDPVSEPVTIAGVDKARGMMVATARCTVEKAPAKVDAMIRTEPFSAGEGRAIAGITPSLSACLDTNFRAKFSRQSLRALLADALYSYAVEGRTGALMVAEKK